MLKEHNKEAYEATKAMLLEHRECCLVAATGIGKSNIATELIRELDLNALVIAPRASIRDNWTDMPDKYDIPPTFSTMTYQYFIRHYKNLYGFDAYIFDEAHHTGAKKWGAAIKDFRTGLDMEFVLGLTADPNRYSDKSERYSNEKNIINVVDTVFNGHVVYGHDQKSAIENGILPRATYVCSIYNSDEMFDKYAAMDLTEELRGRLNYTRTNCEAIEDTLRKYVPSGVPVKGIVFVDSINNIDIGVRLTRRAFPKEAVYYIHSKLSTAENAETLEMFKNAKSGFIVAVDMINEGLHIEGVNTVIMLRKTGSPSIYTQQIGRGLAANGSDVTIFDFVRNDTSIKKVLSRIKSMKDVYQNNETYETEGDKKYNRYPKISDQFITEDKASDILEVFDSIEKYFKGNKYQRWTKEEDDIIREYYPIMGTEVFTKLNDRTKSACLSRAVFLNVHKENNTWTKEEDDIIREYYPIIGYKVVDKLPGRTISACRNRAIILKIKFNKLGKEWTKEEDDIIREYYPVIGNEVSNKLPGRSKKSCINRAKYLNIYIRKFWTKEEDDIIREYYPTMGSKVASKLPERSELTCVNRAGFLNVKCKCKSEWTKEEDEILREYYPIMGTKVASKLPGRTEGACKSRAKRLNINIRNFWTKEEDDIIREYYPIIGYKVVDKLPGRSEFSCVNRARFLNVHYTNRWTKEEDDIIREYYPTMGSKVASKLPGRTAKSCRARACTLHVNTIY